MARLQSKGAETRFWQASGGFERNIRETGELPDEIWYTHHNPVCRGLVKAPEEWE